MPQLAAGEAKNATDGAALITDFIIVRAVLAVEPDSERRGSFDRCARTATL
jgi:hypothetical protein